MRVYSINSTYSTNNQYFGRKDSGLNTIFQGRVANGNSGSVFNPNAPMNKYLARVMKMSRIKQQELIPEIKRITEEVIFNFKRSQTYALDINPDNRKKYVVILHGLGQNVTNLQHLYKPIINDTDFAVIAPEYRGFGKNKPAKISNRTLLEDSQAAINYLKKDKQVDTKDIYILGHSLGGFVASSLARNNPDISGLILVSSAESLASNSIDNLNISIPNFVKFIYKHAPILQDTKYRKVDTAKNLKKISLPVDIIHSKDDKIVNFRTAYHLGSSCENLNSICMLNNGGHAIDSMKISEIVNLLKQK